jgi:amino acid adenylation domain-containing protein
MLEDAGVQTVVCDDAGLSRLPLAGRVAEPVRAPGPRTGRQPALPAVSPGDLCYLLYTSGSTGKPKGVMQEHECVVNMVRWQCGDSVCGPGSATAQFSPISFDLAFQEILCTLAAGGTLVCLEDSDRTDAVKLWEIIRDEKIARLFLPYAALEALALFGRQAVAPADLREVISAGEQLKCTRQIRALFSRLPGCRLVNQYGPTETHVATCYHLDANPESWPVVPPIGHAISGTRLAVLDDDRRPVPPGEAGQLWIGGPSVARGYWRRPELTAERFVSREGTRWYASGDLVRAAGPELEYLGRMDDQIKVRGTRIEPAEVEAAMMSHPAVGSAAVVAVGSSASTKVLVAFVASADGGADLAELRDYLADRLAPPMVPTRFEHITELPVTPTGKVDRLALRAIAGDRSAHGS